jgi:hypothetical protein
MKVVARTQVSNTLTSSILEENAVRLLRALEKDIEQNEQKAGTETAAARASVLLCRKALQMLRVQAGESFQDPWQEIAYFKRIKPRFYALYIYHVSIYNFLIARPEGGRERMSAYIAAECKGIERFFDHNQAFYRYYRAGAEYLDHVYFTRGGNPGGTEPEDFSEDGRFATSHDYKLSKIIANERYQDYLEGARARLSAPAGGATLPFRHPAWTATQTDAIELIYALKAAGAINNGNIDIAELVGIFECIFQTELKEYYHKFTDITRRKKEMPLFLNKLKDGLLKWIDDKLAL